MPTGGWLYSYLFIWFLVLIESAVVIVLVRQVSGLLSHWIRNDPDWGLPLGSLAPELPAIDLFGNPITSVAVTKSKRALFFVSSTCNSCDQLMMRVTATSKVAGLDLVLVLQANELSAKLFLAKHGFIGDENVRMVCDPDHDISNYYKVDVVPFVVVVNAEGRIAAKRSVITLAEIAMLISAADVVHSAHKVRETLLVDRG